MALATVTGYLKDVGLVSLGNRAPELVFEIDEDMVTAGSGTLIPQEPVSVTPASDGSFSVDLHPSTATNPYALYRLTVNWQSKGISRSITPKWRLLVPDAGGPIADMIAMNFPNKVVTKGDRGTDGNVLQQAAIDSLTDKNVTQDGRLTAVESKNTSQDTAITAARTGAVADAKTYTDAGDVAAKAYTDSKSAGLGTRIDNVEVKNTEQDGRLNGFLLAAGTNLNTIITTGSYTAVADSNWASLNYPQNAVITLRSFFWSATNGVHIADTYGTPSRHYFRMRNSSGWLAWESIDARIDAVEAVNVAQTSRVDDLVASGLGTGWTVLSNDVVAWAVVDASRRRSDLEIAKDGKLTQRVVDSLKARMGVGSTTESLVPEVSGSKVYLNTPSTGVRALLGTIAGASNPTLLDQSTVRVETGSGPQWITAATGVGRPVFPTTSWAAWGDSLTYSQATGQASPTWPEVVAADLGVPVYNGGRQGQATFEIAVRQGGLRPLLTVTGDSIPASGSVGVTVVSPTDGWRPSGTSVLAMEGTLAGVPGTLYHDASTHVWTFARDAAGSATACPPSTPFIGTEGVSKRADNVIIWAGTNNATQQTAILRDIASMVAWLTPYDKRYLVIGLTTPGNDAVNAALAAAYGSRFEDLRSYMISSGLAAAGITPTSDDTAAIAANNIPPSLMTDATHFNQAGYNVIGARIAARIRARNWN